MFTHRIELGFPTRILFQPGTAYEAAARAFGIPYTELPHIPRYSPAGPTEPAPKVTMPVPTKSQSTVTPKVTHGHKCAGPGCRKKCSGKATYCGATCRKRAQRARDKKNGVSR